MCPTLAIIVRHPVLRKCRQQIKQTKFTDTLFIVSGFSDELVTLYIMRLTVYGFSSALFPSVPSHRKQVGQREQTQQQQFMKGTLKYGKFNLTNGIE